MQRALAGMGIAVGVAQAALLAAWWQMFPWVGRLGRGELDGGVLALLLTACVAVVAPAGFLARSRWVSPLGRGARMLTVAGAVVLNVAGVLGQLVLHLSRFF